MLLQLYSFKIAIAPLTDLFLYDLKVMDPDYLSECCQKLDVKDFEITFLGTSGQFWLPADRVTPAKMLFLELIGKTLGVLFKNVKSQRLSPTIAILIAK